MVHYSQKGLLAFFEQGEVRDMPMTRHKVLYPATPVRWASVRVRRGMAGKSQRWLG